MTPALEPIVLSPGDGPTLDMGQLERIVFKAVGPTTGGAFDLAVAG
ncbi:MAG: hypothetical protein M3Y44_15225 [Actinomycetota bacterium]|nr:hypothetical protein [Actinomycetota bacterium]